MSSLMELNDRLFRELDRLDAVDVKDGEALRAEVERARTIGSMSKNIVENARTMIQAETLRQSVMTGTAELVAVPRLLMGDSVTVEEMKEAL